MTSQYQAQINEKSSYHLSGCTLFTPPLALHLKMWTCTQCKIKSTYRWKITANSQHHKIGCTRRDVNPLLLANIQWGHKLN